jgi:DNA repair exonuclease SbcCD ATPase subunit
MRPGTRPSKALEEIRQKQFDVARDHAAAVEARAECRAHLGRMQREIGAAERTLEKSRQELETLQALREQENRRLARVGAQAPPGTMTINGQVYQVRGPATD